MRLDYVSVLGGIDGDLEKVKVLFAMYMRPNTRELMSK